jgi:hypothetical protein
MVLPLHPQVLIRNARQIKYSIIHSSPLLIDTPNQNSSIFKVCFLNKFLIKIIYIFYF